MFVSIACHVLGQLQPTTQLSSENWFDRNIGIENSGIINGPRYKMEFLGASSSPFFGTGESPGMITIDQRQYSATLLYDIYKDEIIVKHIANGGAGWFIQLDKNPVKEFVIANRLFRNFGGAFREVLFESNSLMVVAKRSKSRYIKSGIQNYVQNDEYFTLVNGDWKRLWTLSGLSGFLSTKEEKDKLKRFISVNDFKNRKFPDEHLVKVARFVDELRQKAGI